MFRLSEALDTEYPKWAPGRRLRVISLHEHLVGRVKSWMLMLLAAVGLLLLISCANVANLMLARATARSREIGIRAALGATRWRLIRGLLAEGLLLSLLSAAIGVVVAWWGIHAIKAWLPAGLPRLGAIAMDLRVLGAATAAAILTGATSTPAVHASRPDLTAGLKDAGRANTAAVHSQRRRNGLVVAEVALAVVLLVGAGLFIGSFVKLMRIDPGFDYRNVLTFNVGPRFEPANFRESLKLGAPYTRQMLDAVSRVPGVETAAAVANGLPLTGSWSRNSVEIPGRGELKGDDDSIDQRTVSANYLQVMRIPLLRGRYLNDDDREGSQPVIVINDAAARKYWPGEDAPR